MKFASRMYQRLMDMNQDSQNNKNVKPDFYKAIKKLSIFLHLYILFNPLTFYLNHKINHSKIIRF